MINGKIVAIDVDGVLLDFVKKMFDRYGYELKNDISTFEIDFINEKWSEIESDDTIWGDLEPLIDPKVLRGDFDLYLTALPKLMKSARISNLLRLGFPQKPLFISHDKVNYCIDNGIDVLVDDKPKTIKQAKDKGLEYVFIKPYYATDAYCDGLDSIRIDDLNTYLESI